MQKMQKKWEISAKKCKKVRKGEKNCIRRAKKGGFGGKIMQAPLVFRSGV